MHHSVTSIANHNDVACWDYTGRREYFVSLARMTYQLKDIPMVQDALKDLN